MEDEEYYRLSAPALNMDPETEDGLANILADNARLKAEMDSKKLPHERGNPPLTFMECEDQVDKMRHMFAYNPETGILTRPWMTEGSRDYIATRYKGREGYGNTSFYGYTTASANVVWLLHHGRWPKGRLRRRDGDPRNDRIENLLEVVTHNTPALPFQGRKPRAQTSRGVARCGPDHWQAFYRINGKQFNLGRYKTEAEALAVRHAWERGEDLV